MWHFIYQLLNTLDFVLIILIWGLFRSKSFFALLPCCADDNMLRIENLESKRTRESDCPCLCQLFHIYLLKRTCHWGQNWPMSFFWCQVQTIIGVKSVRKTLSPDGLRQIPMWKKSIFNLLQQPVKMLSWLLFVVNQFIFDNGLMLNFSFIV